MIVPRISLGWVAARSMITNGIFFGTAAGAIALVGYLMQLSRERERRRERKARFIRELARLGLSSERLLEYEAEDDPIAMALGYLRSGDRDHGIATVLKSALASSY